MADFKEDCGVLCFIISLALMLGPFYEDHSQTLFTILGIHRLLAGIISVEGVYVLGSLFFMVLAVVLDKLSNIEREKMGWE